MYQCVCQICMTHSFSAHFFPENVVQVLCLLHVNVSQIPMERDVKLPPKEGGNNNIGWNGWRNGDLQMQCVSHSKLHR